MKKTSWTDIILLARHENKKPHVFGVFEAVLFGKLSGFSILFFPESIDYLEGGLPSCISSDSLVWSQSLDFYSAWNQFKAKTSWLVSYI